MSYSGLVTCVAIWMRISIRMDLFGLGSIMLKDKVS